MSIGIWQIVLILLIVLIVFGSGKLPKVMEDLAKGLKSFREGMGGVSADAPPPVKDSGKVITLHKKNNSTSPSKKAKTKKHK